jgi:hypothetical protein
MTDRTKERDLLIEAAASAHRDRDALGRPVPSPAWYDLSPADREEVHERLLVDRWLERALDPAGLSSTGREVVDRARRLAQAGRR